MKYGLNLTLGSMLSIPQRRLINVGHCPCESIAGQMNKYMEDKSGVSPDQSAMEFYALNQAVTLIEQQFGRHTVLPQIARLVTLRYRDVLVEQTHRLTVYTLLVTTRESRHLYKMPEGWWKNMNNQYSEKFQQFNDSVHGEGSEGAVERFRMKPPKMDVGRYTAGLTELFNTGKFGGSYGGKPWGNIAAAIASFMNGHTSAEMFVDTAYTLAHNNGPMFNKGMLYTMYSHELYKVLDIQRAGRVAEYMIESKPSLELTKLLVALKTIMPDRFAPYVDYYEVEALGALKSYPNEKKQQELKHGPAPAKLAAMKKKAEEAAKKAELEKMEAASKMEVWPGTYVKIVKRAA